MLSIDDGYQALRAGNGVVHLDRDVVVVSGPDAATFLQGQLSQDVAALAVGSGARSYLLEPTGKVGTWLVVTRLTDDSFLLDVDAGFGAPTAARLQRFKLRTKADIDSSSAWAVWVQPLGSEPRSVPTEALVEAPGGELVSYVLDGVSRSLTTSTAYAVSGTEVVGDESYEPWRIEHGVPKMGAELVTGETIPAEAGQWVVDASVSFTKGCFTGQELVARIDSRGGNVPRQVRGLVIDADRTTPLPAGADVVVDGKVVGTLTSVAWSPGFGAPVALASIARAVTPPAAATVRWDAGEAAARLEPLPLTPPG